MSMESGVTSSATLHHNCVLHNTFVIESTTICYGQIVTLNEVVTDKMLQEEKCYATKLLQGQMLHTIRMLRDSYVTQLVCYENTFCYNVVANLTLHRHPPLPALLLLE